MEFDASSRQKARFHGAKMWTDYDQANASVNSKPAYPWALEGHLTFSSQEGITNAPLPPPPWEAQVGKSPTVDSWGAYFSCQMPHPGNCQVVKCPLTRQFGLASIVYVSVNTVHKSYQQD